MLGVYAGLRGVQWAARDGVAAWFFQTFAWSGGVWYAANHVEQYDNDVSLAGGTVDLCRAVKVNFGQLGCPAPRPQEVATCPCSVSCLENGGQYLYGAGDPKWFLSIVARNDAMAAWGVSGVITVDTLNHIRDSFGYIPGNAAAVAAGTADVVADSHGNVQPRPGPAGPPGPPGADGVAADHTHSIVAETGPVAP